MKKNYRHIFLVLVLISFYGPKAFSAIPVFNSSSVGTETVTGFTLTVNVDIVSTVYYAVTTSATVPAAADIKAQTVAGAAAAGSFSSIANIDVSEIISGLSSQTQYWIHFFAEDGADQSAIETLTTSTLDVTAPTYTSSALLNILSTQLDLEVNYDEASTVYYVVTQSSTAPNQLQIIAGLDELGGAPDASGNFVILQSTNTAETINGLSSETQYFVYFLARDASDNSSAVSSETGTTLDVTAPTYTNSSILNVGNTQFDLRVRYNEAATVYYVVTQSNSAPSQTEVRNGQNESGGAPDVNGSFAITAATNVDETISGLSGGTQYYVYFIAEDASANQSTVQSENETTSSSGVSITAPSLDICIGSGFVPLGDIVIAESSQNDFRGTNNTYTLVLSLDNSGFIFDQAVGSVTVSPSSSSFNDIDAISISIGFTSMTLTYDMDNSSSGGNGDIESMIISGLMVQADGSQASANLIRSGGTGVIIGNSGAATHASLTSGTSSITFTNDATANTICAGETILFSVGNNAGYNNYDFALNGISAQDGSTSTFSTSSLTNGQTVSVIASGAGVCSDYKEQVITVSDGPSTPVLNSDALNNEVCVLDSITFTVSPSGAAFYTYKILDDLNSSKLDSMTTSNVFKMGFEDGDQISVVWTDGDGCNSESGTSVISVIDLQVNFSPVTSFDWSENPYSLESTFSSNLTLDSHSFSGPGVIQDASNNYFFDPSFFENNAQSVNITFSGTVGGCTKSISENFVVFDPNGAIGGLADVYCFETTYGAQSITFPSSPPPPSTSTTKLVTRFFGGFFPYNAIITTNRSYQYKDITGIGTTGAAFNPQFFNPDVAKSSSANVNTVITLTVIIEETTTVTDNDPFLGVTSSQTKVDRNGPTDDTFITQLDPVPFKAQRFGLDVPTLEFCNTDAPVDLVAEIPGGTFSGTHVSGNVFDPSAFTDLEISGLGPETVNIEYLYTDGNGCVSLNTKAYIIYQQPPPPTAPSSVDVCQGSNIDPTITVSSPLTNDFNWYEDLGLAIFIASGETFDTGFKNNDPPQSKTFYVTQVVNGCESQPTAIVYEINAIPNPIISNLESNLCINGGMENFNLSNPGGQEQSLLIDGIAVSGFSGTSHQIDPTTFTAGVHTIEYLLSSDVNGDNSFICEASDFQNFTIDPLTPLNYDGFNTSLAYCNNDLEFDLISNNENSMTLARGTFSGTGINGGPGNYSFDPSNPGLTLNTANANSVTYQFTDENGCTNSTNILITIYDVIVPIISSPQNEFCITDSPVTLQGVFQDLSNIDNGTFVGPGITTGTDGTAIFDPAQSGAAGDKTIEFSYVDANLCTESTTKIITINALPAVSILNLNNAYCINNDPQVISFNGNYPGGIFSADSLGLTDNGDGTASLDLFQAAGSDNPAGPVDVEITYSFIDGNSCYNETKQKVRINNKPEMLMSLSSKTACRNDAPIVVSVGPQGIDNSVFELTTLAGANRITALTRTSSRTADINQSLLDPNEAYIVRYIYTFPITGCENSIQDTLFVYTDFDISLEPNKLLFQCEGDAVEMDFLDGKSPFGSASEIVAINWDFKDGTSSIRGNPANTILGADTHGGMTSGTYLKPFHVFNGTGTFNMEVSAISSDGCDFVYMQTVIIYEIPEPSFTWSNVCLGSDVIFEATDENPDLVDTDIDIWEWEFGDGQPNQFGQITQHAYSMPGNYIVTLTATSNQTCSRSVSKAIYQVPSELAISSNTAYRENFDSGTGGWLVGGDSASWKLENPSGGILNGDAKDGEGGGTGLAWKTSDPDSSRYNSSEQSWVHSPCLDISQLERPVFQMDVWYAMNTIAGVVVQVNTTDNTDDNSNWLTLGQVGGGLEWYTQNGIQGKPGDDNTNVNAGWTGNVADPLENKWVNVAYELDAFNGASKIRFRIALGNVDVEANPNEEGFAFDNVFIGERTRTVLLENFTNVTKTDIASRNHSAEYRSFITASDEIIGIEYHTSFPGADPINKKNIADPNARSAYYGIDNVPVVRLDGDPQQGTLTSWLTGAFGSATLIPSDVILSDIETPNNPFEAFNVRDTLVAVDTLPANTVVHIAVVEKVITSEQAGVSGGEPEFLYVVRKMLPDATGTKFSTIIPAGETRVIEASWATPTFYDSEQAAVVVFVQNEDTGEILQAKINEDPSHKPGVFTANEPELEQNLVIYPNPASSQLIISFKERMSHTAPVKIYDTFGKMVFSGEIQPNTGVLKVNTDLLSAGMYHIVVKQSGQESVNKRLIVIH